MCNTAGMFWTMTKALRLTEKYWALAPHVSLQHLPNIIFTPTNNYWSTFKMPHRWEDRGHCEETNRSPYSVGTAVLSWRYSNHSIKMTSQFHLLPKLTTSGPTSLLRMHALISQTGVTLPFYIYELWSRHSIRTPADLAPLCCCCCGLHIFMWPRVTAF